MRPWKRRDRIFDEFFRDFEEEFREIEDNISRIFEEAERMSREPGDGKPIIYGFSMRVGPEGEPKIEKFGNIPTGYDKPQTTDEREPLIDVIEKDKEIMVVAELPGIDKEDISLYVLEDTVEIDVDTATRRYHKRLTLPGRVKSDTTRSTHKNGVLEITLERAEEKKREQTRVKVE